MTGNVQGVSQFDFWYLYQGVSQLDIIFTFYQ